MHVPKHQCQGVAQVLQFKRMQLNYAKAKTIEDNDELNERMKRKHGNHHDETMPWSCGHGYCRG